MLGGPEGDRQTVAGGGKGQGEEEEGEVEGQRKAQRHRITFSVVGREVL